MTIYAGPTATDLDHIPVALKELRQWVLWRGADKIDEQTGKIKLNKIPIDPHTLRNADTTDPMTWGSYEHCIEALPVALESWQHAHPATYRGGGLGYVFASDDPYCGIDLDTCCNPETDEIDAWTKERLERLDSYTEITPSGTGLHILVEGSLPPQGRKKGHVEMYDQMRFFTMTGWHLPGTPPTIEPRQEVLTAFHTAVFGRKKRSQTAEPTSPIAPSAPDITLIEKARAAKNAPKFAALWGGDTSAYEHDDSSADLALCCMLAFWTQDPAQIDRLFRQSGLLRDKWDEKRGAQTYGERTITEALARQTEHYRFRRQSARQASHTSTVPPRDNPAAPAPAAWTGQLLLNQKDVPTENLSNLLLILEHHPDWRMHLWWDTVRTRPMRGDLPIDETILSDIALWFGTTMRMSIRSLRLLETAVRRVCQYHAHDLLQEWLEAIPAWDGVERLTEWLADVASITKDAYGMEISRLIPVSMVARALDPGCQYRTVVILEGPEDSGKSKLVQTLASMEWYVDFDVSMESKEAHMLLQGAWVAELAELATLSRTEEAKLKSFLTLQEDVWIPKYSNFPQRTPRRTIFIGTVNPEEEYLKGQTGNTRFLPIQTGEIDCALLEDMREQLFAEALVYYRKHPDDWWQLSQEGTKQANIQREYRRQTSIYESDLADWLDHRRFNQEPTFIPGETSWSEIARYYLQIEREKWKDKPLQMQIAQALRALGYIRHKRKIDVVWAKSSDGGGHLG